MPAPPGTCRLGAAGTCRVGAVRGRAAPACRRGGANPGRACP